MNDYYTKENQCGITFRELGEIWHLWTSENFELIFKNASDFTAGMNILAVCAKMELGITIITFELMSNHIHICLASPEHHVKSFFENLKLFLRRYSIHTGYTIDWKKFEMHCRPSQIPRIKQLAEQALLFGVQRPGLDFPALILRPVQKAASPPSSYLEGDDVLQCKP